MKNKNQKLKELFSANRVITLLKFKSAVNLRSVSNGRRNRESEFYCEISFGRALSIAPPIRNTANSLQI